MTQKNSFFSYVFFNVAGMLGLSCYILADTFFVSAALGTEGLAALNLAISVYSFLSGAGLLLGIGGASRYAVLYARGDREEGNRAFSGTFLLGLLCAAVFLLAGIFGAEQLGSLLGAEGQVLKMTAAYLRIILCFSPCFLLNNILLAFVRNDGGHRLAMASMLAGSFSNILLDYLFLFPLSLGMSGAAFATGLAPVISMGLLSLHLIRKRNGFHLRRCRLTGSMAVWLCAPGLSSLVTELASGVTLLVFNLLLLRLVGNVGVAAYGVTANLALVATAVFTGISQGIQPLISHAYGQRDRRAEGLVRNKALVLALGLSVLLFLAVLLWAPELTAIFNRDGDRQLALLAGRSMRLYFAGFLPAGFNIVSAAYLSSSGRERGGFAISLVRGFAALLPLVLALSTLLGPDGIWLSFPAAELCAAVLTAFLLFRREPPHQNRKSGRNRKKARTA